MPIRFAGKVLRFTPHCNLFLGRKLKQDLKPREAKPLCTIFHIISATRIMCIQAANFFNALLNTNSRYLIKKHFIEAHSSNLRLMNKSHFNILRLSLIEKLNSTVNTQTDSICAKPFCLTCSIFLITSS